MPLRGQALQPTRGTGQEIYAIGRRWINGTRKPQLTVDAGHLPQGGLSLFQRCEAQGVMLRVEQVGTMKAKARNFYKRCCGSLDNQNDRFSNSGNEGRKFVQHHEMSLQLVCRADS